MLLRLGEVNYWEIFQFNIVANSSNMRAEIIQSLLIVPLGSIQKEVLVFLQNELIRIFGFDIEIAREEPIPQYAFDPKRRQYHSTKILEWLKNIPVMDTRILGIVDFDLYVPELNFV